MKILLFIRFSCFLAVSEIVVIEWQPAIMDTTPNAAPNPNQNRDFVTLKPLRPSRGSSSNLRASRSPSASRSTEQSNYQL